MQADVVIVGGGVIGWSGAYQILSEAPAASVLVIERNNGGPFEAALPGPLREHARKARQLVTGMPGGGTLFEELGFQTTYYLSVNDLVIEQCAEDIQKLTMPRFVSWRARRWLKPQENQYFIHTTYTGEKFATDIRGRVWEGGTVTYTSLQVAYYLGFSQVILVGVDHNYVTQGKPNATVVSQGEDPNHFHPGYFGKGFRWQLPDLVQWEEAYRLARRVYEADGRQVVDATIGGKLRVFERVEYDSLF